ncbi:hypothetical protein LXA43DRAFT_891085 [Ganoderma leucocontextum]|nr:hypothetical protein LXA43DRAFT_891085 [Ganoderma leucocontextum]
MVLQVLYTAATTVLPFNYWPHAAVAVAALVVIYAYAQGRSTTRERDLHARVVILTGPFTPLGLVTLTALAKRGASIIALSPYPLSHPVPSLILPLLRSTTKNDNIFAEHCDLTSATSIRKFCTSFLTQNDTRIDALVFAHEYPSIGRIWFFGGNARKDKEQREADQRESASLASFLITTLLLPALLVAPVDRDIRIISVVNPFYAAALPTLPVFLASTPTSSPPSSQPIVIAEGHRALRTVIVTRHLQRILDSLPNRKVEEKSEPNKPPAPHPSNILAVSACPGISRRDTIAPLLGTGERGWSLAYIVLFLPLVLLTKTSESALQTVLHSLFLPTPLKRAQLKVDAAADDEVRKAQAQATPAEGSESGKGRGPARIANVEVLKPGALYRECAVVEFDVPKPAVLFPEPKDSKTAKGKEQPKVESILEDDGEFGGEAVGRAVWEWYEVRLKEWEARDTQRVEAEEEAAVREEAAEKEKEKADSTPTPSGESPPEMTTRSS